MKDYYDIDSIANKFDFDGAVLSEALKKTFENREHTFTIEQFNQVIRFGSNGVMQEKWKMFIRKINVQTEDYNTVLKTIRNFLEPPFAAAIENKTFNEHWSSVDGKWL